MAPIRPLAWEPQCAASVALKSEKKTKKKSPSEQGETLEGESLLRGGTISDKEESLCLEKVK